MITVFIHENACMVSSQASHRFFFFNDTATTEIYTLSLHDALPISAARYSRCTCDNSFRATPTPRVSSRRRSEEHTSELQSLTNLVCRLLLEKKKKDQDWITIYRLFG